MTVAHTLPYVVQRHYNAYAYLALPLCAALAEPGGADWFDSGFVQLHAYRLTTRPEEVHLDLVDAFAYQRFLPTETVPAAAARAITDAAGFVREHLAVGRRVVLFTEDSALTGQPGARFREYLFVGHAGDRLTAVGFDARRRFTTVEFTAEQVRDAFRAGLRLQEQAGGPVPVTAYAQLLSARAEPPRPPRADLAAQVTAYALGTAPPGFDPRQGWWWFDRALDLSPGTAVSYGTDVYALLGEHLRGHLDAGLPLNYPMFHLLAEHKRLLLARLSRLTADPGVLAGYRALAGEVDLLRMKIMLSRERRKVLLTGPDVDGLVGLGPRERELVLAAVG
ncbi:hypothetical protein Cme02nite_50620 [Catellatospora methionotrophica]|uniref:Uncharacterized protein n=1 Tax=Catellatospora methionotrophica TaxID=121620 RepID=A0A8J3LDX9_9ACTN|nr:hypothetical protein [Catellatospora methionotrophica]GIG16730.1 hypothetical protein Cme02nite_50620 [Catellatospora methionotrophica]